MVKAKKKGSKREWINLQRQKAANARKYRHQKPFRSTEERLQYEDIISKLRAVPDAAWKNYGRGNVRGSNKTIDSFSLGIMVTQGQFVEGVNNKRFKDLFESLQEWAWRQAGINFLHEYHGITCNRNLLTPTHVDRNNTTRSYATTFGYYDGGELRCNKGDINIQNGKFVIFDATQPHSTRPFNGERYSIVYWHTSWKKYDSEYWLKKYYS